MPEISDHELAVLRRAEGLLNHMISDPKEGLDVKRKIKSIIPDAKFPELDVIDTVTAPIQAQLRDQQSRNEEITKRLDSWEKNQKDTKEESDLQTQLDSVRKAYSFTNEGMQKVVDRMKAKNNPDADAAAAWVAAQERKAAPITNSALLPSALDLYGSNKASADLDLVALNKDPQGWADQKIVSMLNEFAQQDAA